MRIRCRRRIRRSRGDVGAERMEGEGKRGPVCDMVGLGDGR